MRHGQSKNSDKINVFHQISSKLIIDLCTLKALSDDTIFAPDCSRFDKTRFQSCHVRATIVSCETHLRKSGGIGANRVKESCRVRGVRHDFCTRFHPIPSHTIYVSFLSNPSNSTFNFNINL